MAKEKISRKEYDVMRSYLSKKKNTKINLDDYEVYEPVSHHSNDNEDIKRELKRKQNMKNTIRLTESELKNMIVESVKKILNENSKAIPTPHDILMDIIGEKVNSWGYNDYEIVGKSGILYRFFPIGRQVSVQTAPIADGPYGRYPDWDNGQEFSFERNAPFIKAVVDYILSSSK